MNAPKQKRRRWRTALRLAALRGGYHVAALAARVLGAPFWIAEQCRGKFADDLENEEGNQ